MELENSLEQEQESLVNRLWKRMDKLEAEKRSVRACMLHVCSKSVLNSDIFTSRHIYY